MRQFAFTTIFSIFSVPSEAGPTSHGWLPKYKALHGFHRRGGSSISEQPLNSTKLTYEYSVCSLTGERPYMEDEYYVSGEGSFAAVFDGHGGKAVSRYLRQNLYANYQAALPTSPSISNLGGDYSMSDSSEYTAVSSALHSAFSKVDEEVQSIVHWSFQGSTACAVVIDQNNLSGIRSIVSANLGDSRAILNRNGTAIDLTEDHKPNNKSERERIEKLGGSVDWCGDMDAQGKPIEETGVYRINGNLALSRAIGDRCDRPFVSNVVEISHTMINEELDSFIVLASDGLFDVMTSQEVVSFIHEKLANAQEGDREILRQDIATIVAEEALERGTSDNITVLIIWIN